MRSARRQLDTGAAKRGKEACDGPIGSLDFLPDKPLPACLAALAGAPAPATSPSSSPVAVAAAAASGAELVSHSSAGARYLRAATTLDVLLRLAASVLRLAAGRQVLSVVR